MARDELDVFAHLARDFCTVMQEAGNLPLSQRVFGLFSALTAVVAAGSTLPVMPGDLVNAPRLEGFPGLGSYEEYWTVGPLKQPGAPVPLRLSEALLFVHSAIAAGLARYDDGDREAAAGIWGLGFEKTWGRVASELVHALHPVVAAYRNDLRQETHRGRSLKPVLPAATAPPPPDGPVGLGLEFEPVPGGLEIVDVSAHGLAAGKLRAGDLVIAVNGRSIDELVDTGLDELPLKFEIYRDGETLYVKLG